MPSLATFVRRTPGVMLQTYFDRSGIASPLNINFLEKTPATVRRVVDLIEQTDEVSRARFLHNADRIASMADEVGQNALFGVVKNREKFDALDSGHARAIWVFLNELQSFRHGEEVRFTDEHRRGRMWDGFVGEPGLPVRSDRDTLDRFKAAVRERFRSQNVHVDVFNRQRASLDGEVFQLTQATVYRDGRLDEFPEFIDGRLDWRPRRPIYEAALTYETNHGVIEVVAADRASRESFVRLFSQELLGTGAEHQRLPFRQFDLSMLLRPFEFPTDASDGIEWVRLTYLRLMPIDTAGERLILECSRLAAHTIWDMATQHFGSHDPLRGGWLVTQAKLAICFHSQGSHRRKILPLTVTMPHGCDLKDRTERETIVGEKYLRRWKMVRDV